MASDARVHHGLFAQAAAVAVHAAARPRRRCAASASTSAATSGTPSRWCGTSCGSPGGIPLGYALPGRTLERLDPFDAAHPNHLLLVSGMTGSGKTMAAIILLIRALAQGASGFIIDRAGHFEFLASLIPGAASVEIGADAHAINSWDVEDPGDVVAGEDRLSARAARAAARRAPRRPATPTGSQTSRATCSAWRSPRCMSAAR